MEHGKGMQHGNGGGSQWMLEVWVKMLKIDIAIWTFSGLTDNDWAIMSLE